MSLPADDGLLAQQLGIATRSQLESGGWTESRIRAQISAGRWRDLNERVVVNHNGPLTWQQRLWAVDLSATNPHAMAGLTAMQQWGVRGFEADDMHVLVPQGGRVLPVDDTNVVVHESRRFSVSDIWHGRAPQLVSLPRAAMDAAIWAEDLWTAMRIFVAPVQQRRSLALDMRNRLHPPRGCDAGVSC